MLDILYLGGALFLWYGLGAQAFRLFSRKSSGDLSLAFLGAQTLANTLMLPLAIYNGIPVWIASHTIILVLCVTLLVLAIKYRGGTGQ